MDFFYSVASTSMDKISNHFEEFFWGAMKLSFSFIRYLAFGHSQFFFAMKI